MGWVDQVPRAGKLYIGGLHALYQTDLIQAAGITHVLSAIDYEALHPEKFEHLKQLHVRVEDHPNENLLQYLEEGTAFIDEALRNGGGVFVHCAMGKSRSATFVVAYLMWKYRITWEQALDQLCEGRPVCEPNFGFKEQLGVYWRMINAESEQEKEKMYQHWLATRFTGESWEWENRQAELKARL